MLNDFSGYRGSSPLFFEMCHFVGSKQERKKLESPTGIGPMTSHHWLGALTTGLLGDS